MVADAAGESAYAPAPAAAAPAGRANPYVGPRAIESGEALFGRDNETVELLNQVIAHRVVLMYAVSGAGKTSLLKAGLIPALEARGFLPLPPVQVRCAAPPGVRANRYTLSVLMELEAARRKDGGDVLSPDRLASLSLKEYLRQHWPDGDGRVLMFDPFEDVLRIDPTDTDVKEEFFAGVGAVLRDAGVWAIFAMREEYVAGLDPYLRHLPTRLRRRRCAARPRGPASRSGRRWRSSWSISSGGPASSSSTGRWRRSPVRRSNRSSCRWCANSSGSGWCRGRRRSGRRR
jgi:hypothetical protein